MVDAPDDGRSGGRVSFYSGWGGTCGDYTAQYAYPGYGGAAFWHKGKKKIVQKPLPGEIVEGGANVTLADGHSKFFKVGQLAGGTNFNVNQDCSATNVVDPTQYMWNPLFN